MVRRTRWVRVIVACSLTLFLVGCGGGSGSGSAQTTPSGQTPVPASVANFTAVPSELLSSGGSMTLTWQATNADSYSLSVNPSSGVGGMPVGSITGDSTTVTLPPNAGSGPSTYTFSLTATGATGTSPATATTTVTVDANGGVASLTGIDWPAQVIYFLMPDRFDNGNSNNDNGGPGDVAAAQPQNPMGWYGGDFQGVTNRIQAGYFTQLGATAIWMTPVYLQGPAQSGPSTNNPNGWQSFPYHGYAPWNFNAPDPHFGSIADLQSLVQSAHANRTAVILGQIVNDAGIGYPPYVQESNAIASGQMTLDNSAQSVNTFLFHHFDSNSGQCEPYLGSYNATWDCPLDDLPDFDSDNPAVQSALDAASAGWLGTLGLDGIRLDAATYVQNSFWSQYLQYLRAQGYAPLTFAEVLDGAPDIVGSYTQAVVGFEGAENYPLYFAITQSGLAPGQPAYFGYSNMAAVDYAVQQDEKFDAQPFLMVNFIDDQDMPRFTSLLINAGVAASDVFPRWQIAEALSFTLPGIPMIYYGDEVGMEGTWDPYQAVANGQPSNNIREPMTLWTSAQRQAAGVQGYYDWLQALAQAHALQPALQTGTYTPLFVPGVTDPNVYIYLRGSGASSVLVAINASSQSVDVTQLPGAAGGLPAPGVPVGSPLSLVGGSSTLTLSGCANGSCITGILAPWSVQVLSP